jgi:hypothetical protein
MQNRNYDKYSPAAEISQNDNSDMRRELTTALAHRLWISRGSPEGSPDEDWLKAEQLLREKDQEDRLRAA